MQLFFALCLLLQAKAGDKLTVTVESELDLDIEVRDGTGESKRVLNVTRKEKFAQEVLEAAEGKARSVKIQCVSSLVQKSGTDTPIGAEKPTPLQGVTFLATRTATGWSVREQNGGAPSPEGKGLGTWNDASRLLPAGEAKAGATWEVDARDVLALLAPTALREATGKLACKCEAAEGGRVAVSFTGTIKGKAQDEAIVQLDLTIAQGNLVYDVAKGRPVALKVSGSVQTIYDMVDVFRRPNEEQEERRKVGEIVVKSRRMEANFAFSE